MSITFNKRSTEVTMSIEVNELFLYMEEYSGEVKIFTQRQHFRDENWIETVYTLNNSITVNNLRKEDIRFQDYPCEKI